MTDEYDDDLDEYEDDEEDEELPVIPAPGTEPAPQESKARARRRTPAAPKGNVKAQDARMARASAVQEAQGRRRPEPAQWREDLAVGDRSKAVAALSSRRPTHNAGSGFGLAG